jgi:16S rRNA (cytosine1402-N4)-methyltransferase
MMATAAHTPVMLRECLEALALKPGAWYVDGTFGAGGHSRALLEAGVRVLAIDQDPHVTAYAQTLAGAFPKRFKFAAGNFRELDQLAATAQVDPVLGVLLDLGVSSMQLDEAERGFAFRQAGPLDMRMSAAGSTAKSAAEVVNSYDAETLAAIIYKYGEERYSRRIAQAIVAARREAPLHTTTQLSEVIQRAYPRGPRRDHPARRTFQALRIYVNDELGALQNALAAAERVLSLGGRLVVISYHSLEDRIVKHTLRDAQHLRAVTKRPLTASEDEINTNPRARSAKLRAAEKVAS